MVYSCDVMFEGFFCCLQLSVLQHVVQQSLLVPAASTVQACKQMVELQSVDLSATTHTHSNEWNFSYKDTIGCRE